MSKVNDMELLREELLEADYIDYRHEVRMRHDVDYFMDYLLDNIDVDSIITMKELCQSYDIDITDVLDCIN